MLSIGSLFHRELRIRLGGLLPLHAVFMLSLNAQQPLKN